MLAVALCLGLFLFWGVVGYALVSTLHASRSRVQDLLLAPAVGLAATILPVFFINRMGLPVERFGLWVLIALLILAGVVLFVRKPQTPWREALPFAGVLFAGCLLTGWPMLLYGFDWLSYCNDDMANYCLAAQRLLHNGFWTAPTLDALATGQDYAGLYWFMHVPNGARYGAELGLAWTCSLTGLSAHEAFMPHIIALHLAVIAGGAAVVFNSTEEKTPALLAALLMAGSALLTFGALYQLLGQATGMAVMGPCVALTMRNFEGVPLRRVAVHGLLAGLMISALLVVYPEVAPFLGVSFFIYAGVLLARRQLALKPTLVMMGSAAAFGLVVLNRYGINSLLYMLLHKGYTNTAGDPADTLFPFYLMPDGLANFWGFVWLAMVWPNPTLMTAIIVAGAVLLLVTLVASGWMTWRGHPVAAMALFMLLVSAHMFRLRSGFPLYKIAMYVQPFVLGTLVLAWFALVKNRTLRVAVPLILAAAGLHTQFAYVSFARGRGASFNEIPGATETRLNDEFQRLVNANTQDLPVLCDSHNIVVTKFQSYFTRGQAVSFPSSKMMLMLSSLTPEKMIVRSAGETAREIATGLRKRVSPQWFEVEPGKAGGLRNQFTVNGIGSTTWGDTDGQAVSDGVGTIPPDAPDRLLIAGAPQLSLFNRRRYAGETGNFVARPVSEVRNHLMFMDSSLGRDYYLSDTKSVAMYQLEKDPVFHVGTTMAGIGRHFLFEVLNPSEKVRIVMELSASLKSDGKNELPPAEGVGIVRERFPLKGRGSARVFSPPLTPQVIQGRSYVAIDMGVLGSQFPDLRRGARRLYGGDVVLDRRMLVGFARDMSAVSEAEYEALQPPERLTTFAGEHNDLLHRDLEYTGLYEDGWVSETSAVMLTQKPANTNLLLRAEWPQWSDQPPGNRVTVKVDGQVVATQDVPPGGFEIRAEVPPSGNAKRKVELEFTGRQYLPMPDGRPVSAQIKHLGFEPAREPTGVAAR